MNCKYTLLFSKPIHHKDDVASLTLHIYGNDTRDGNPIDAEARILHDN